jgi:uncharacterized protein
MALILDVKVVPSSGKQKAALDKSGKLKIYLKSPPEGGKANVELIKFLAKALSLTQADITILLGATSRNKRLKLNLNFTIDQILAKLGVEKQLTL